MSGSPPRDELARTEPAATLNHGAVPPLPVPGTAGGGEHAPGQATAAIPVVPVETEEHPRRGLTPVTFLLTLFLAYFLYKVQIVVITLIVGILLATAISGPTELLTKRFHMPRGLSICSSISRSSPVWARSSISLSRR
jgi:hypothetical protein